MLPVAARRVIEGQCPLCIGRDLVPVDADWRECPSCGRRYRIKVAGSDVAILERIPVAPYGEFDWRGKSATGGADDDAVISSLGKRTLVGELRETADTFKFPLDAE